MEIMVAELFTYIGEQLKTRNPYVNVFNVNGIQLRDGRIVELNRAAEQYIGISDLSDCGFYIRFMPDIIYTPLRQLASNRVESQMRVDFRVVFYAADGAKTFDALAVENNFVSALKDMKFAAYRGPERKPQLLVNKSSIDAHAIFKQETKLDFNNESNPVFVSVDVSLKFMQSQNFCQDYCRVYREACPPVQTNTTT